MRMALCFFSSITVQFVALSPASSHAAPSRSEPTSRWLHFPGSPILTGGIAAMWLSMPLTALMAPERREFRMNFDLTDEQIQVRDMVREFAAKEVAPYIQQWD